MWGQTPSWPLINILLLGWSINKSSVQGRKIRGRLELHDELKCLQSRASVRHHHLWCCSLVSQIFSDLNHRFQNAVPFKLMCSYLGLDNIFSTSSRIYKCPSSCSSGSSGPNVQTSLQFCPYALLGCNMLNKRGVKTWLAISLHRVIYVILSLSAC